MRHDRYSNFIPMTVDGENYDINWLEGVFHDRCRLIVYHNGKQIGYKDFPHNIDQGQGTLTYAVRAILHTGTSNNQN